MGGYHSWPVAINTAEPEGRLIWETCPFAPGTQIYLHVLQLPSVRVKWGDEEDNADIMGELELGPVPPRTGEWPLQVGCSLYVVPAWQLEDPVLVAASQPEPVNGDTSGVSLHRRNLVDVRVSSASLASTPDNYSVQMWLQDGRGVWAKAPDYGAPPPIVTSDTFLVDVQGGPERIYAQIIFSGAPTDVVHVDYGELTAPIGRQVVRFGGVVAPVADQLTDIRPRREAELDATRSF